MNAEKLFKLAMVVFLTATIIGCIDSSNDDSSNGPLDEDHIPTIIGVRLVVNDYYESDDFTTPMSTQVALIPPTNLTPFDYVFSDYAYTVVAPTGFWKIRLYAVDDAGNESNEIELDFLVRE